MPRVECSSGMGYSCGVGGHVAGGHAAPGYNMNWGFVLGYVVGGHRRLFMFITSHRESQRDTAHCVARLPALVDPSIIKIKVEELINCKLTTDNRQDTRSRV